MVVGLCRSNGNDESIVIEKEDSVVQLQVESVFLSTAPSNSSFENGSLFSCITILGWWLVVVMIRIRKNIYNHFHEAKIFKQQGCFKPHFKLVDNTGQSSYS